MTKQESGDNLIRNLDYNSATAANKRVYCAFKQDDKEIVLMQSANKKISSRKNCIQTVLGVAKAPNHPLPTTSFNTCLDHTSNDTISNLKCWKYTTAQNIQFEKKTTK